MLLGLSRGLVLSQSSQRISLCLKKDGKHPGNSSPTRLCRWSLPALRVNPRGSGTWSRFLALPPLAASLHKNHLESGHGDRRVQKACRGTPREAGVWRLGREQGKSQAAPLQPNTVAQICWDGLGSSCVEPGASQGLLRPLRQGRLTGGMLSSRSCCSGVLCTGRSSPVQTLWECSSPGAALQHPPPLHRADAPQCKLHCQDRWKPLLRLF